MRQLAIYSSVQQDLKQGKPLETVGRKVIGLKSFGSMTAGLPDKSISLSMGVDAPVRVVMQSSTGLRPAGSPRFYFLKQGLAP